MIQYIVAAGIGGLLGLSRKKGKKFADGGVLSEFDALESGDIFGNVYATQADTLRNIRDHLAKIGMKITSEDWKPGYDTNQRDYQMVIEPDKEISDEESMAIHRFFKKIDTMSHTRNFGEVMDIQFTLD